MSSLITPRVFIIRHGETEWSLNGRHTGLTELSLTDDGEKRVVATGKALVGNDRLIVPGDLAHIYVSPRRRARATLLLLGIDFEEEDDSLSQDPERVRCEAEIRESIREWDYGDYEGKTSKEIAKIRQGEGHMEPWSIWRDGCPGGETPAQITHRVDQLIQEIRHRFHKNTIGKPADDNQAANVLIVAHGHILRAFACRWIGKDISDNPSLILEAGGVGLLSYEHHSIAEPAIVLGGSFTVPGQSNNQTPLTS